MDLDSTQGDLAPCETACTRPLNLLHRSCFSKHIREHTSSLVPAHLFTLRHRLGGTKLREETEECGSWIRPLGVRKLGEYVITCPSIPPGCPSIYLSGQPVIDWDRRTVLLGAWTQEWQMRVGTRVLLITSSGTLKSLSLNLLICDVSLTGRRCW